MKVWVDLANSPHVQIAVPIVRRLQDEGHEVLLTARDHAQTVELATGHWPDLRVVGGRSPGGVGAKGRAIAGRAMELRRLAAAEQPDVAFSHGSYAQLVAARMARVPAVTMMDYEHQPANHLSFRLARVVVVPEAFPAAELRRQGGARKVRRYPGFKEELYLAELEPDPAVLADLGLDPERVIAVFRPAPHGALYHRGENLRFDDLVSQAVGSEGVQAVVLPRSAEQRPHFREHGATVPDHAVDATSLLALADVTIGAGGTMTRESALLGTPTYTVFAGKPAAADRALIEAGRLIDLRQGGSRLELRKRTSPPSPPDRGRADAIAEAVLGAIYEAARRRATTFSRIAR
jgi:uncharacterized protein